MPIGFYFTIPGTEQVLDLTPGLNALFFALDILEWTGVIPDPLSLLFSLFTGRPREEATTQVIQRLYQARNPVPRLKGVLYQRALQDQDIVISDSSAGGQAILGKIFQQNTLGLEAQGLSHIQAFNLGVQDLSRQAQAGLPLPAIYNQPAPAGLVLQGDSQLAQTYNDGFNLGVQKGLTGQALSYFAEQYLYKNGSFAHLLNAQWVIPPPPPSGGPGPGQGGGPPIGPPPTPGDELSDCCAQISAAIASLGQALSASQGDPNCCANIVTAINDVASGLQTIATLLPAEPSGGPPPPTLDLTPVVDQLAKLVTALGELPGDADANTTKLADQLAAIATSIGKLQPGDLSQIVKAIQSLFDTWDVPQDVYTQLAQDGFMSPTYAQLATPGAYGSGAVTGIFTWLWGHLEKLFAAIGADFEGALSELKNPTLTVGNWIYDAVNKILKMEESALAAVVDDLVALLLPNLQPVGVPAVGDIHQDASKSLGQVAAWDLNLHVFAALLDLVKEGAGEGLIRVAERVMELLGRDEIREVQLGPTVRYGIARIAEQQAKSLFMQELPGAGEIADQVTRGLLPQARADALYQLNGLHFSLTGPFQQARYRGLQPFILVRLLSTGLFNDSDLTDEMTFAGLRPASQARVQLAAQYIATDAERKTLRATLEAAYAGGLYADQDFLDLVDGAEHNTDRDSLLLTTAQIKLLERNAKDLETAYGDQFLGGLIDAPTLQSQLEGIGLQPSWINAHMAKLEAQANVRLARTMAATEKKLATATTALERKTLLANYLTGQIPLAAYVAGLVATGLSPVQAAAWGDNAMLKLAGNLRWQYGQQLPTSQAAVLRARVTAIGDQLKKGDISTAAATQLLQNLKLSGVWINALLATWTAMAKSTLGLPVTPVSTS